MTGGEPMTRFLDAPDPGQARRDLDADWPAGRLAHAIEAEEYARAIFQGYRDGPQYEHRPNLRLYWEQWQEARAKREQIERELRGE